MESNLVTCNDVDGLVTSLNSNHNPEEQRLFIDSLKLNLKAVVLHNGNMVHCAISMKESHDNMKLLLDSINYKKYQ
jgi:hypothetical protein